MTDADSALSGISAKPWPASLVRKILGSRKENPGGLFEAPGGPFLKIFRMCPELRNLTKACSGTPPRRGAALRGSGKIALDVMLCLLEIGEVLKKQNWCANRSKHLYFKVLWRTHFETTLAPVKALLHAKTQAPSVGCHR